MGQDLCKCGTETYLEIMNNWWASINIRNKELKEFVTFIKQITDQLKSEKINFEKYLSMIINELLLNGQHSSKAVFKDFFVSNINHLREVILSLIFLCQPTDYIDYIRKCFTELDEVLFDSICKEIKTKNFDISNFHKNLDNHHSISEIEDLSLSNTKNQSEIEKFINEPMALKKETGYFMRVKENSVADNKETNILEKTESIEKEKASLSTTSSIYNSNSIKKREENKHSDMEQNGKAKEEKSEGKELREKSDIENKSKLYREIQNQSPLKVRKESIEIKPLEKVVCTKVKKDVPEVFSKFTYKVEGVYFINRQSLCNILRLYIKLITSQSMTYIFKEAENTSVADKENAPSYYISFNEESQEKLLESIMNLWGCEDIFLDDFLNSRYNSLIDDKQLRDSLFNQLY